MKNRDSEPATKVDDNTERAYRWLSERLTPFDEEIRDLRRLLDEAEARGAAAEREACIAEAAEPLVEADTARDAQRVIVGRLVVGKRRGNHSPEASWDPSSSSSPQPSGSSPGVSSSPSSTPMTDRPDNDPFAIGDEVHLKARRIGKVVAITEDPSDGQVVVVEWGPENGSNTVFRWNRAVDLERRRESDTTAPSDLRCIFCGNPYGNGHSPRCSVTKLGAPEQWWSPPPERERAPLYERSEIEAELIAEAFGVRDGIVEGKVAADAVITIRRLHAVAEAAREVVETARTYGLGQSLAWGGPNPEFPKSNWGKFELAVCRLMAIVPTDSSGEGHDHG